MEDVGADYFWELSSRSFFQSSGRNNSRYLMHDLISELAKDVAGQTCFRLENMLNTQLQCSPKARHLSYISGDYDGITKFKGFYQMKHLRTFLPLTHSLSYYSEYYLTCKVTHDLLPQLQHLRVLSFNGYTITELPNSIGELKQLRYLDLSHTQISCLPESTSSLYNLQTLILKSCTHLKTLPRNMRNLTDLRNLNNSEVPSLEGMPWQLGRLTNLQTLRNFVVGKGEESRIREIGPLLHLRGTLWLSRLENVYDVEDARRADFRRKERLHELILEWSDKSETELDVLDMLEPHRKLKELTIWNYGGLKFSAWVGASAFSNMVLVRLENCNNCRFLPPLGQLCSLKELYIRRMSRVESVGAEFYGEASFPFPVLETLEFEGMDDWKEWFPCEQDIRIGVFPCLKMLSISNCPKLEGRLPDNLNLLSKLVIDECMKLVVSISNYKKLCELSIRRCMRVVHSFVEFESLEAINLSSISEFIRGEEFMTGLGKVTDLKITACEELTSSWQNDDRLLHYLISLSCMVIKSNSHLTQFHQLASLQELHIYDYPSLISFQEVGLPPSLKEITVVRCNFLTYFAIYQIPPSLRRIEIRECANVKSLVEVEEEDIEGSSSSSYSSLIQEEATCLEYLRISECPSLASFSFNGHLPRTLKHLEIERCGKMESISDSFHNNLCLEEIHICDCPNFKSLPEDLCCLTNLQSFSIRFCKKLVSFPRGGLPRSSSNLRKIVIQNSNNLEALPKGMHYLNSLQILKIPYFEGFASFLEEEGFPANLTELEILNLKSCKALLEFQGGLHRLTSLRELTICGDDPDMVSFPPENDQMAVPETLIRLHIEGFPNLSKLNNGLQFLTSLQSLQIWSCPKLASMPQEGLPLSLTELYIRWCPLLQERCKPSRGPYWPYILHIPYIFMGDSLVKFSSSLGENQSRTRSLTDSVLKYLASQTS